MVGKGIGLQFTAPDTRPTLLGGGDTVYSSTAGGPYLRSLCGVPDSELACRSGDFARGPSVRLEMEAGELVYVFVDGQSNLNFDITGTFRLDVNEHTPPTITAASGWFNPDSGATAIEVSGTRGPLPMDSLQFTYLDADGNPVALNDFPGPFRTGMDLTEEPGPNGFTFDES